MSYNKRSNNSNKNSCFCKVCFDAGEPEEKYKSHFVRDKAGPEGKVVCPRLLSTKCNYCKEEGHTIKFCKKLKHTEKMRKRKFMVNNKKELINIQKEKRLIENKPKNIFEVFNIESDDEQEDEQEVSVMTIKSPELTGWAAIAAKPALQPKKEELYAKPVPKQVKRIVNWCDEDSSDEEEYENDDFEDNSAW